MTKYKTFYKNLMDREKPLFDKFLEVHAAYVKDPKKNKVEFNEVGSAVIKKLKQTEDKLCAQSEQGRYAKFSRQLSDKYWGEIRKDYPRIDEVEVKNLSTAANIDDLF